MKAEKNDETREITGAGKSNDTRWTDVSMGRVSETHFQEKEFPCMILVTIVQKKPSTPEFKKKKPFESF